MRRSFYPNLIGLPCLLFSLWCAPHDKAAADVGVATGRKKIVMLTAFEPFRGRPENGSQTAAEELLRSVPQSDDIEYKLCLLPVEYDKASEVAQRCYETMDPKPDLVISTGEDNCQIRLEVRAQNLDDDSLRDNAGITRRKQTIQQGESEHELMTLPVADMYCATETALGPPMANSLSPGYFVCNNTAYRLAKFFKPRQVPFGFIHVPKAECKSRNDAETAGKLHLMVKSAFRSLSLSTTIFSEVNPRLRVNCPSSEPAAGLTHLQGSVQNTLSVVTSACREKVRHEYRRILETERRNRENLRSVRAQEGFDRSLFGGASSGPPPAKR